MLIPFRSCLLSLLGLFRSTLLFDGLLSFFLIALFLLVVRLGHGKPPLE